MTRIYDVFARQIDMTLHSANPDLPMRVVTVGVTTFTTRPKPGAAVFSVAYRLDLHDDRDEVIASCALTLVAPCATAEECTAADLERFAAYGLLQFLHPYLTEHLHDLTLRMGLPPLVLEIFRPGVPVGSPA